MRTRQQGFTFIEILVVMSIIVVLVGMVAVMVPWVQEKGKRTKSTANVRSIITLMNSRAGEKGWPAYSGKNFHLSLVSHGLIDARNADNLDVFFSPGDGDIRLEDVNLDRYKEITRSALKAGNDFRGLTSYAGRRNDHPDFKLTADRLSRSVPVVCDDDEGALHHSAGLIIGYSNGNVKFVEWGEMDMAAPDADQPEAFLGDTSEQEELRGLSSD